MSKYNDVLRGKTLWIAIITFATIASAYSNSYWMQGNQLSTCGQTAYELLKNSELDGLNPADYAFAVKAVEAAQQGSGSSDNASSALTRAMTKYVDDVRNGRFNPRLADKELVMTPENINAAAIVSKGMSSGSCQWMQEQAPPYPEYKQLKVILRKYMGLRDQGHWPQIPTNVSLSYGDRDEAINKVREILVREGDLSSSYLNDGSYYDQALKDAVLRFQVRHGMNPDGLIGPLTAKEMNRTPTDRIHQIQVTMERWRWMPRNPGYRHIIVNIAGFQLEAYQGGQVMVRSPIIVGADYRETPVLTARMTEINFNPSWHVPHGLAVKDKLPELKKDPSFARKHNFVVTKNVGGKLVEVDPSTINWNQYSSGNFPFSLRQRPGDDNALGKIRFAIQSPFNIYLHSTNYKQLFDYTVRTFSSGCIRVKYVTDLAYYVFNDPTNWTKPRIEKAMEGNNTMTVKLPASIPVHINYFTVWTDEMGVPHFMQDVYGQDRQVLAVMQRS